MKFTGERMVPASADATTLWEHVYRYQFATKFVVGKEVLDIACGEGYGAAALRRAGARRIVGVDISKEACEHAAEKYGLDARVGDGQSIPLDSASVDVIVSFETIEHVAEPGLFLEECRRILRPGGRLIISTPNREATCVYSPNNPFHVREFSVPEFKKAVEDRFSVRAYFCQRVFKAAWWNPYGLSAISWPTRRLRGLGRFAVCVRALSCPHLGDRGTRHARENPVGVIADQNFFTPNWFDPFVIRKPGSAWGEVPLFIVAVAARRPD